MCRLETVIRENGSKRVISHFDGPSLTRQEFKDECDIEKIMQRFVKTPEGAWALQNVYGYLTDVSGRFNDVSGIPDYHRAFDLVDRAHATFEALPASLRTRFDNDPGKFMDFMDNPSNIEEIRKMGLAKPETVVENPVKGAEAPKTTAG